MSTTPRSTPPDPDRAGSPWTKILVAAPTVVAAVGLSAWMVGHGGWWSIAAAGLAAVAGIALLICNVTYRRWALDVREVNTLLLHAAAGSAGVFVTAWLLRWASSGNHQPLAIAAVALLLASLVPVSNAIRTDVHADPAAPDPAAPDRAAPDPAAPAQLPGPASLAVAWTLNLVIAVAALTPGLFVVGASAPLAFGVPIAWWIAAALDRIAKRTAFGWALMPAGAGAAVAIAVVMFQDLRGADTGDAVTNLGGGVVALLGCVEIASAWSRNTAKRRLDHPLLIAILATLTVAGAGVMVLWFVPQIGSARFVVHALLAATFVVFGICFIVRGQGFVLAIVLGALVVWVVADRTDHAPLSPTTSESAGVIVALGDSYISGEGAPTYFPGTNVVGRDQCRRTSDSYAYRTAERFAKRLDFVACSGALSRQIWQPDPQDDRNDAIPDFQLDHEFTTDDPDLVLVSIGGNDALFGEVGKTCALPGSCAALLETTLIPNLQHSVRGAVGDALIEVARRFPDAPIVVVPYPQMLADLGCGAGPIAGDEFTRLHAFVAALDRQVETAVTDANARLETDKIAFFAGAVDVYRDAESEICHLPRQLKRTMNLITLEPSEAGSLFERLLPSNWIHNTFHPRPVGHELMAQALGDWLVEQGYPGFSAAGTPQADAIERETEVDTAAMDAPPEAPAQSCGARADCQAVAARFMVEQTVSGFRGVFPPALVLFGIGWAAATLVRRSW